MPLILLLKRIDDGCVQQYIRSSSFGINTFLGYNRSKAKKYYPLLIYLGQNYANARNFIQFNDTSPDGYTSA